MSARHGADPVSVHAVGLVLRVLPATVLLRHPVILMHAGKASHESESRVTAYRGNTVAALPAIVRAYRAAGYRFVTL